MDSTDRRRADTSLMAGERTNEPFVEALPRLLAERGLSIRALARQLGVTDGHLSRVLRQADYKRVSAQLASRTGEALGFGADYFPEAREGYVIGEIRSDPELRDELFDWLQAERAGRSG
ncbi:MAG TPA: hypothetical protein VKR23_01900 [Gaiellaceae bacterium]|nr:hypothetical protein [Gaiellaceae bacterium]